MNKKEKIEATISIVAIILSIVAVITYLQANKISKNAMELTKQANDIVKTSNSTRLVGSRFETPEVQILLSDTDIDLSMFEEYKKRPIHLYVENVSKVPISGVSVNVYVASGLLFSENHPEDALENIKPLEFELTFKQEVLPYWYAIADIRKPLFEYLGKISKDFKYQEDVYSGVMHMIVKPCKVGSSLPILQLNHEKSEGDIRIKCRAKSFIEENNYIESMDINVIYCGAPH